MTRMQTLHGVLPPANNLSGLQYYSSAKKIGKEINTQTNKDLSITETEGNCVDSKDFKQSQYCTIEFF